MDDGKQVTRKNSSPIKVYCLPEEKEKIEAQARAAGLPSAAYLRHLGLGFEVRGVLDYEKVDDLARITADLGRLGGLLKMWLTNDERLGRFSEEQVDKTLMVALQRITENQDAIRETMQAILRQPR